MIIFLFLIGLCLGSFVNAFVYRFRFNSLKKNKRKLSILNGRSICPKCKKQLSTLDLIPLLSWAFLRGRCRYCKAKISVQYPLVEIITGFLFAFSYYFWRFGFTKLGIALFIIWLLVLTGFVILSVYDFLYKILPTKIIYCLGLLIVLYNLLFILKTKNIYISIGFIIGCFLLGGLFYLLFQISQGKWIGGGDVRLGFLLGLLVGGPLITILLLFIASISGTIASVPFILEGKITKKSTIPFGPFLILGAIIVFFFGQQIVNWYKAKLIY